MQAHNSWRLKRNTLLSLMLGLILFWPPANAAGRVWLRASDQFLGQGEFRRAEEALSLAEAAGATSEALQLRRAWLLLAENRLQEAGDAFRSLTRGPTLAQAWVGLGDAALRQGDLTQAISWWRAAQPLQPEDASVWSRLGWAELARGRFWEAQIALEQAWELGGHECRVSYGLAALLAFESPDKATAWLAEPCAENRRSEGWTWWPALSPGQARPDLLRQSLEELRGFEDPLQRAAVLGRVCTRLGLHSLAERAWLTVLAQRPKWGAAWAYLGYSRAAQGKDSLEELKCATSLDPGSPEAWYFLGRWYAQNGLPHAATDAFRKGLELDPHNAGLMVELAYALAGQGNYPGAEETLQAAAGLAAQDAPLQRAIARFYLEHLIAVQERGLPTAELAVRLAPDDPEGHDLLGWAAWLTGAPETAQEELALALQRDPQLPAAWYHQAVIQAALGRVMAAREAYMRAIVLDPRGYYGARAAKALREMQSQSGR